MKMKLVRVKKKDKIESLSKEYKTFSPVIKNMIGTIKSFKKRMNNELMDEGSFYFKDSSPVEKKIYQFLQRSWDAMDSATYNLINADNMISNLK